MIIRWVFNKVVKFARHVIWMRHRAHGTLATDAQAAYWLKLIDRPDYKPVWRWYYDEAWKKKRHKIAIVEKRKRSFVRKIGYVNAVLAILIVLIFISSALSGIGWSPIEFTTTTRITVVGKTINATLHGSSIGTEYLFSVDEPFYPARYQESVAFRIGLKRTDGLLGERLVLFNVIAHNWTTVIDGNSTKKFFSLHAIYYFDDGNIVDVRDSDPRDEAFLGIPLKMVDQGQIGFILVLFMEDYSLIGTSVDRDMVTMKSTGGESSVRLIHKSKDLPHPLHVSSVCESHV